MLRWLLILSISLGTLTSFAQPSAGTPSAGKPGAGMPPMPELTPEEFEEFMKLLDDEEALEKLLFPNGMPPMPPPSPKANSNTPPPAGGMPSFQTAARETEGPKGTSTVGPIVLSDESPYQVIALLQQLTGKPILAQQNLPNAKITFDSRGALSRAEAINALESVLSLNGVAITPVGDTFFKAVPMAIVSTQSPQMIETKASSLPPSQRVYSKMYTLKYLAIADAMPMVQPFLSPSLSSIVPFPNTHTLMITDTALNLQRVEEILGKIDQPISMREEVLFYTLKNISASELQKRFDIMRDKALKPYLQGNTWFEADDRSNQLIVITHPSNIPVIQHFIDNLDIDATPLTRSEVIMVRHGEAVKIVEVLQKLIDSQKASLKDRQDLNGKRPDIEKTDKTGINQQNAENSLEFSDYLTLSPDERTNAIVVCGTRSDIKQIGKLINELDSLLPQVRIEVVISEVLLNDTLNRGIEAFGILYDNTGTSNVPAAGNVGKNLTFSETGLGGAYSVIASVMSFKLDSVFKTAETNQNVRILSAPTIVTTHNKEAQVKVVQQYPIITQTITNTASTADNAVNNSITYKDIGITLTVTPKIGNNGVIQMEIDQILSDTSSSVKISNVDQPIVASREAKSYISALDSEVVILGGLQVTTESNKINKLAILGDLPIVGNLLFSGRNNVKETRELIIFIKPHLINTPMIAAEIGKQALSNSPNQDKIEKYYETNSMPNMWDGEIEDDSVGNPLSLIMTRQTPIPPRHLNPATDENPQPAQQQPTQALYINPPLYYQEPKTTVATNPGPARNAAQRVGPPR